MIVARSVRSSKQFGGRLRYTSDYVHPPGCAEWNDARAIRGDQAQHSSSHHRRVCVLWFQLSAIPTPRQVIPNTPNVMSRESFDIVDQIETERFQPTASLDPRSIHLDHSSLPCHSLRCSSTPEDKQDHQPPLGVELTGYRLLTLVVILTFGIPKAISSYRGQAVSTTLDWVSGTLLAAM